MNPAEALASTVRAISPRVIPGRAQWKSPIVPWSSCPPERRQILARAWEIGEIRHHLTPSQDRLHEKFLLWDSSKSRVGRQYAFDISRRWGKSVLSCVLAIEKAIQNKSWRIVFCAPEKQQVHKLFLPLIAHLTSDCPPGLHGPKNGPEWIKSEGTYYFRNGSRIELIGLDVNPDGARGTGLDFCILDEAGFFDNFEYLLKSVLTPQMLGRPWARVVGASTPPKSPSHYWSESFVPDAINRGAHQLSTIEDADQYTWEEIEEMIAELGGRKSVACRREFFCEHITDETMAIVPEFREVKEKIVVDPGKAPYWRTCITAMDPGWKDHTAVLFGYVNFDEQKLIIEDEVSAPRLNSQDVATAIKLTEKRLWEGVQCKGSGSRLRQQPYMRVSDNDPRLLNDLSRDHDLAFTATLKDNFDQQINAMRIAIQTQRIIIHPRCGKLVLHLMNATWKNQTKKQFAWENGQFGHFDLVAALLYMWRLAQSLMRRNPAPFQEEYVKTSEHNSQLGQQTGSKWSRRGSRYYVK